MTATTTGVTLQINNVKIYVPVGGLLMNDNITFSEYIKQGFKRPIPWNKYRPELTTQPKSNNLDYLIDPTFINFNRLFVLSFKNGNDFLTRYPFDKYCMSLVEIKELILTDIQAIFDQPVKNLVKRIVKISRNNDYTTGILLHFLYYQNYHELIGIDLSRETNTCIPQQISFVGNLEKDDDATMFFVSKVSEKNF